MHSVEPIAPFVERDRALILEGVEFSERASGAVSANL